ncbi:YadA C-terminal domain-containing protein [Halomonas sp. M20]|uniref:YadA C-terminal domain-containing protein n=1 Tax=Halomonas sp. M20 TaxID=2763264 RepID=UPI001D0BBD17|nr:YadA C-terminal domain-containing protein [Halomonas sp. M20]
MKIALTSIAAAIALATTAAQAGTNETHIKWLQNDTEVDWATPDVDPGANGSTALNEVVEHEYNARRKDRETMIDRTQSNKGFISRVNVKSEEALEQNQSQDQSLDRLDRRVDSALNTNSGQERRIDANTEANARQDDTLANHDERIAANTGGVYANAKTNTQQDAAIAGNRERIGITNAQMRDFQRRTNASFAAQADAINRNSAAIGQMQGDISELRGDVTDLKAGVAAAIAAASHQFNLGSGSGFQMSVAGGYYESENAASLAIGAPLGERTFMNINASHDSRGNAGYGAGVNIQF